MGKIYNEMEEEKSAGKEIVTLSVHEIRAIYPKLNQYFEFEYIDIQAHLNCSLQNDLENYIQYCQTSHIAHLPDDYQILFAFENKDIMNLLEGYVFSPNWLYVTNLINMLLIMVRNRKNCFYNIAEGDEMEYGYIQLDKKKLYEFLLDNYKEYNFQNLPKAQITISYGLDTKITINNHHNWLYDLLKKSLHEDLTNDGVEYVRLPKQPERPKNAPSFSRYIIYNLYLLLMDVVGSDKKNPVLFRKFIIDFCKLCDVGFQKKADDKIKDLLNSAIRHYKNMPIPYSLVKNK